MPIRNLRIPQDPDFDPHKLNAMLVEGCGGAVCYSVNEAGKKVYPEGGEVGIEFEWTNVFRALGIALDFGLELP